MTVATVEPTAAAEDWLVCLNELRTVREGRIACPAFGGLSVSALACADCRHLSARREERARELTCSTEAEPRGTLRP